MPVAARSKACISGRSLAGIAGSNPAGDMDVSVVSVVCCQVASLRRADHSPREVLLSVYVSNCVFRCNSSLTLYTYNGQIQD